MDEMNNEMRNEPQTQNEPQMQYEPQMQKERQGRKKQSFFHRARPSGFRMNGQGTI